jgi:predicted O-methyltransferase YrrM
MVFEVFPWRWRTERLNALKPYGTPRGPRGNALLDLDGVALNSDPTEPNADLLVEDTRDQRHRAEILLSPIDNTSPMTFSFLAKPRGRSRVIVEARDDRFGSYGAAAFNLRDREVKLQSGDMIAGSLEPSEDGWYLLVCTMSYRTDTSVINLMLSDDEDAHGYPGDGRSGIFIRCLELSAAEPDVPRTRIRPVRRLYDIQQNSFDISTESIDAWRASNSFGRASEFFRGYPANSLLSDSSRVLLYHLIIALRPNAVLEIGTYLAGTSEVLARALWEAGCGTLDTIDPYGGKAFADVVRDWSEELRQRVTFHPVDSAIFFHEIIRHGRSFDLIFIDGNHEFEFAYFDLLCASRVLRPGGVVVLDNVDQPGPKFASHLFLERNPEWVDIGGAVHDLDLQNPLKPSRTAFPDTAFYVLQAPPGYVVSALPRSFGSLRCDRADVERVEVELCGAAAGTVHLQVFARTFGPAIPEELQTAESFPIRVSLEDCSAPVVFDLRKPLRSALVADAEEAALERRVEIILAFTSDDPAQRLALKVPPRHYSAE